MKSCSGLSNKQFFYVDMFLFSLLPNYLPLPNQQMLENHPYICQLFLNQLCCALLNFAKKTCKTPKIPSTSMFSFIFIFLDIAQKIVQIALKFFSYVLPQDFPSQIPNQFFHQDSRQVPGRWSAPGILIFKSSTISLPTLKLLGVVSISINLKRYIGLLFQNYIIDINLLDQGLQMGPNTVLSQRFPSHTMYTQIC